MPARRPNVILILTDDQGYGDVGCHWDRALAKPTDPGPAVTPYLDRVCAEGVEFTRFYTCPVCTPTRATLLTGRYNQRTRAIDTYIGRAMMDPAEVTLNAMLSPVGYRAGIFGKWHLGDNHPLRPQDHGFDEVLVHRGGGIGQAADPPGASYFDPILLHNGVEERRQGYCTDVFTSAAIDFIAENRERPFFAYLATNAPHTPVEVAPELMRPYLDAGWDAENAGVLAMVTNIDTNVGRLLGALDDMSLSESTLVIFLGDNGPQQDRYRCGLRGLKGSVCEGGIRVPFFIRWPGTLEPGRKVGDPSAHIDLVPTVLELCEAMPPEGVSLDGRSLVTLLRGEAEELPDRTLFFQWHRGDRPELYRDCAATTRRHKLVNGRELYDLLDDRGERADIAVEHPEVVGRLRAEYEAWFEDVSATRGYDPPRIYLGTPSEDPVTLTRQDWRGPRAGWADDSLGYWEVDVRSTGPYNVALRFAAARGDSSVAFSLGDVTVAAPVQAGSAQHTFDGLRLERGPGRLEAWVERDGTTVGVHYVDVSRGWSEESEAKRHSAAQQ